MLLYIGIQYKQGREIADFGLEAVKGFEKQTTHPHAISLGVPPGQTPAEGLETNQMSWR